MDTGEGASAVDESHVITDPESIFDRSDTDRSASKAPGDGEDVGQKPESLAVSEKHSSGSQPLPDCRVCLVRLPDFLLSQNSNDSSENMVNKVADVDGGSLVREGDSSFKKNFLATQNETVDEKSSLEIAETPTRNKMAIDLLICENTETELPHTDVTGVPVVHDAKDVILVEDSQMPSCGQGQEEQRSTNIDHAVDSEMCIMETPEKAEIFADASESIKPEKFSFRLFSDERQGHASSPERLGETVHVQQPNVDDFLLETSHVTVVPDSCAIDSDHITLCNKDETPRDTLLTVAVETEAVADVQMEDAVVAMETEEMNDSLLSQSSIFQNADNVDLEISASSMNLRISDVEPIAEPDCLTPKSKPAVKVGLRSAEDSMNEPEKRNSGEIRESTNATVSPVGLLDDSPAAATSISDEEDHMPLAAFMKMHPKQPTEGQRITTADQQIPSTQQQIDADATQSEERQLSQIGQQAPTGVQEIQDLSSQTQDLPSETCMSMLESEMQQSLTELPSGQPLQTQPKEAEQRVSQTTELSPSVCLVTQQLQSENQPLTADVISPEPVINISTSSEDDVPLGLLARKHSNVLSDKLQTYLKVDADVSSVLNLLGETQSKLVTKLRSRGRPKRSPYSSSSTGLTLRSRSLVRAETDSLRLSENNRSGQRNSRKISFTIPVENTEIQGKQIVRESEDKVENVEDVGKMDVTFEIKKEDKEPKHDFEERCKREEGRIEEAEHQMESADEKKNEDENEVDTEKKEPEKHDSERQKENVEENRNETIKFIEIEDENEENNSDDIRLNDLEERQNKSDQEKTRTEDRKLKTVTSDNTATRKTAVESNNNFTQICDPKSAKNRPSNEIIRHVISDDTADAAASGITPVENDVAVGNVSDANWSIEARHSADDASKRVTAAILKADVTKVSATVASLISPAITSNASPASLRKSRTSDIPLTPTSSSTHRVLSRGHLMLSRSKQLFAMPNSGKLKTTPGGTESPKSFFQSIAESVRTRSQGSPFFLPSHVFSPSASPSAGILRKKRLREETTPSVDSPSPPHKVRKRSWFNEMALISC